MKLAYLLVGNTGNSIEPYGTSFRLTLELTENSRTDTIEEVDKGKSRPTSFKHGLDTLIRPFWYNRSMLEGRCLKCGIHFVGWALLSPRNQTCPKCGAGLEITEDGNRVYRGYSPFTAERYLINPPTNVPPSHDKKKGSRPPSEHHRS